jgi:hypothetical protein
MLAGVLLLAGCGDSPNGPTPPPPVPNPPIGTPPAITAITIPVTRTEVDQDVTVTATVQDETPAGALTYLWSASAGTVSGAGPSVTWRLPKGATTTPADVTITLTVVEPYQVVENGALVNREHRVTRQSSSFRAHDSEAEIGRMALHFLVDLFADSSKSADQCLVDFWPACPGTDAERQDIVENRSKYLIRSVEATIDHVSLNNDRTRGEAVLPCTFRDVNLATGAPKATTGTCRLDAVYQDSRWWLCSSGYFDYVSIPAAGARSTRPISGYWRSDVDQRVK